MKRTIFTEEHKLFRETIKAFVKKEIEPYYEQWEKDKQVPKETYRKLGELGGLCPMAEEEYGGLEVDILFQTIVNEEIAYKGCSGMLVPVHNDLVFPYFDRYGTHKQKQKWYPSMISGDTITALAMSEPDAGSFLAGIKTTAVKKGNKYIINGSKTFISNGQIADLFLVAVRTKQTGLLNPDPRKGMSMVLVESDRKGFTRGNNLDKIGFHAQDTSELFFSDVEIPEENVIGEVGKGWEYMMENLQIERLAIAVGCVASAHGALDKTIEYVKERKIWKKPVSALQNTKFELAECATQVELGYAMIDRILESHINGDDVVKEVSMAKYWCSQMGFDVSHRCMQLWGGYGYMKEYPISRWLADSKLQMIYGGTNEIMKVLIAQKLGLSKT
jgi:acyl-CoA dehydrogenase